MKRNFLATLGLLGAAVLAGCANDDLKTCYVDHEDFDGYHPVLGLWMIDQECCGMGIREDKTLITGNLSRFAPHVF